jgi:hypothetical protein
LELGRERSGEEEEQTCVPVWCSTKTEAGDAVLATAYYQVCTDWETGHAGHHSS